MVERVVAEARGNAAEILKKFASKADFLAHLRKFGAQRVLTIGKRIFPVLLVATFIVAWHEHGVAYACADQVVPVDLLMDAQNAATKRFTEWWDEGHRNNAKGIANRCGCSDMADLLTRDDATVKESAKDGTKEPR